MIDQDRHATWCTNSGPTSVLHVCRLHIGTVSFGEVEVAISVTRYLDSDPCMSVTLTGEEGQSVTVDMNKARAGLFLDLLTEARIVRDQS